MQEEVTQRTIALCVEATKLSAGMLQQAMKKVLDEMQKGVTGHKTKLHHGKQTLRQLMKHNTGVSNIEITDRNIRAFSATAKKYGIDFALKKDTSGEIRQTAVQLMEVMKHQYGFLWGRRQQHRPFDRAAPAPYPGGPDSLCGYGGRASPHLRLSGGDGPLAEGPRDASH